MEHENEGTAASAEFYPFFEGSPSRVLSLPSEAPERCSIDGLPIPPSAFFLGYGSTAAHYLEGGRRHLKSMRTILETSGLEFGGGHKRVLDFGCGAGRMIRGFTELAERHDFWGVDIRSELILWCQQHLSPPFRFVTTTTFPHLPFEDRSFDLVYAGSVFTHTGDLEDMWLMELRRLLRPGGFLFVTVHDNHTVDLLLKGQPGYPWFSSVIRQQVLRLDAEKVWSNRFQMVVLEGEAGNAQVFHDIEFIRKRWGRFFEIRGIHPDGHDYQTAIVLTKPLV